MRRVNRRFDGIDPQKAWEPYSPTAASPWDRRAVAHLHRRAGFSPSWEVLERDLEQGPEAAIARVLQGEPATRDGQPADRYEAEQDRMATRFGGSGDLSRLQAVWIQRMIFTPHALRERMTLFWHDHFATSNAKVNDPNLMRRQNDLLRRQALGDFKVLLAEMGRDPAMLIWLDATTNRKAHPNENYAREVMELFSLGRGRYSEKDIQEAARAFTGVFIQGDAYREVAAQHDLGPKTILGRTGDFKGDDVPAILLDQPACAEFLCGKLYRHFVSDIEEPSAQLIAPLADAFRTSGYDIASPVGMILHSRHFFDPTIRKRKVKSPVEFVVGTIRALEIFRPSVPPLQLAESTQRMGQALFAPPSVAGWDGGTAWLNTATALERTNFLLRLVGDDTRFRPRELLARHDATADPNRFFAELLLGEPLPSAVSSRLKGDERELAGQVLATPEYQLA